MVDTIQNGERKTSILTILDRVIAQTNTGLANAGSGGSGAVSSVNGRTGAVTLTSTDVGLANANNTSDVAKPLSTAAQAALSVIAPTTYTPISVWGDSRCAQNWLTTTTPPAVTARGFGYWFETLSQCGRLNYAYNQGVSGDTISQTLARITADTPNASGIPPSQTPVGIAIVLIGTNSINAATPLATCMTQLNGILSYLTGRGFKVMLVCEWPRGDGVSAAGTNAMLTPASQTLMYAYAHELRKIDIRNVALIDVWPRMADPQRTDCVPLAGYLSNDFLHESVGAGFITGLEMARVAQSMGLTKRPHSASQNGDQYDASVNTKGCLNTNPMLVQGAGGTVSTGATGVCPVGYTLSAGSGLSVVGSFVTTTLPSGDTRPAFRMVISGTATSANAKVSIRQTGLLTNLVAGDTVTGNCEINVTNGHVNFSAPTILLDTGLSTTQCFGGLSISGDLQLPTAAVAGYYGVSNSPDLLCTTLPSSLSLEIRPTFTLAVASSLTIDILSATVRKK